MAHYLSVPEQRRERALHEKARFRRRGELHWIRSYLSDFLDDDTLYGEPPAVQFLDQAILHMAGRTGWIVPADARTIAGRFGLRVRDVKPAIDRLVELQRFELITAADRPTATGNLQIQLPTAPPERKPVVEQNASGGRAVVERRKEEEGSAADVTALINDSLASAASRGLAQTRARAEKREEKTSSNGKVLSYADALAIADEDERELVNRLAALAARGSPQSAAVIRYECIGLPDAIVARAIEAFRGRTPRPTGGGYVVNTLRALRVEAGLPDNRPRIAREPELR